MSKPTQIIDLSHMQFIATDELLRILPVLAKAVPVRKQYYDGPGFDGCHVIGKLEITIETVDLASQEEFDAIQAERNGAETASQQPDDE